MNIHSPSEIVDQAAKTAIDKGNYGFRQTMIMSFLAGAYTAIGGLLSVLIGCGFPEISANNPSLQKFLMGAAFPVGLIMVILAGAELFTGNCAYFIPNTMSGRQPWKLAMKNWSLVWMGNFLGVLFFTYFLVHLTHVLDADIWRNAIQDIATIKTSNSFLVTFLKGIGANWLVCLAVWLGISSKDTSGKIFGIWWPIMTFVVFGYEQSIANMFFLSMAMFQGSDLTIVDMFVKNLIPASLGNIVGGALFVGAFYWYVFEKLESKKK